MFAKIAKHQTSARYIDFLPTDADFVLVNSLLLAPRGSLLPKRLSQQLQIETAGPANAKSDSRSQCLGTAKRQTAGVGPASEKGALQIHLSVKGKGRVQSTAIRR